MKLKNIKNRVQFSIGISPDNGENGLCKMKHALRLKKIYKSMIPAIACISHHQNVYCVTCPKPITQKNR